MSYVLVSLVRESDEALQASDEFARWFASKHAPSNRFHDFAPDHCAIREAVQALAGRKGFVLGHGGDTLRAGPGSDPLQPFRHVIVWADAFQFAQMFEGARVYVFACSTLAEHPDMASFGRTAVEQGVTAYAGHYKPIHAPGGSDVGLHDTRLRNAIARIVKLFLDGCDSPDVLLMEARSAISKKARVPLTIHSMNPNLFNDPSLPLEWSLDWQRIMGSLKVETRAAIESSKG